MFGLYIFPKLTNIEKDVFSSCHERGTRKKFWVPMRNRTSDLRICALMLLFVCFFGFVYFFLVETRKRGQAVWRPGWQTTAPLIKERTEFCLKLFDYTVISFSDRIGRQYWENLKPASGRPDCPAMSGPLSNNQRVWLKFCLTPA